MDRVQFLTLDELLALHERLIERFGGSAGVRDLGLAESALFRPKSGYYDDVVEMAAALFESLLMNHAFVDGNKRIAFFATDVFLRMNGWKLEVETREAYEFLIGGLEAGTLDRDALDEWLRASVRPEGSTLPSG
ncbi:MAG: type II toxin-antitoxin system death-on-curing family toxin [Acidobacteria bacterium]|nr:type II toxin-antitoxin system death-on-curing family toxin [Acidobacteriota bacterium]